MLQVFWQQTQFPQSLKLLLKLGWKSWAFLSYFKPWYKFPLIEWRLILDWACLPSHNQLIKLVNRSYQLSVALSTCLINSRTSKHCRNNDPQDVVEASKVKKTKNKSCFHVSKFIFRTYIITFCKIISQFYRVWPQIIYLNEISCGLGGWGQVNKHIS